MRFSTLRLAVLFSSCLVGCYAELPGAAPLDDPSLIGEGGLGGLGGGVDTGVSPSRDGGGLDSSENPACDGAKEGATQQRVRYAEVQAVPPDSCTSETQTRTCEPSGWSGWSGSFQAEQCGLSSVHSCGSLPDGATQTRQRFPAKTVTDAAACAPEQQTRTCTDGTLSAWSGSAIFDFCEVALLGTCNAFSAIHCEPQTACVFRTSSSFCLGTAGRTCSANGQCQHTCVTGACTPARVPRGGSCDDAGDCVACSGSSVSCSQGVCMCGAGASCTANDQCDGTCVASKCVEANTSCDRDDDCRGGYRCSKPGGTPVGTCLQDDGKDCTSNAQCIHVCRPPDDENEIANKKCAPPGKLDTHCDENEDCEYGLVCRQIDGGLHCVAPGQVLAPCDEDEDCASSLSCSSSGSGGGSVCFLPSGGGGSSGSGGG